MEDVTVLEQLKALEEKSDKFAPLTSAELRERALASERDIKASLSKFRCRQTNSVENTAYFRGQTTNFNQILRLPTISYFEHRIKFKFGK